MEESEKRNAEKLKPEIPGAFDKSAFQFVRILKLVCQRFRISAFRNLFIALRAANDRACANDLLQDVSQNGQVRQLGFNKS